MSWLFRKKEPPERAAFREEFEKVVATLHRSGEVAQMAVGHSINMANSVFLQRFPSMEFFSSLPKTEQYQYIENLSKMEEKLNTTDPHAAIGFGLFKMWIGAVTAGDKELVTAFSKELAYFSKKGDLPV